MITIPLDNTDTKPFYIQIYEYIRKEILNGNIAAEEKLPSARNLAANLNVSRSTVDTAYDQLVAEGYLDARPRQGYFANHVTHLKQIPTSAPQKENNKKNTKEAPPVRFDFNPDSIDLEHFLIRFGNPLEKTSWIYHPISVPVMPKGICRFVRQLRIIFVVPVGLYAARNKLSSVPDFPIFFRCCASFFPGKPYLPWKTPDI